MLRRAYNRENGLVLERIQVAEIQGIMNSARRRCRQGMGLLDGGGDEGEKRFGRWGGSADSQ